MAGTDGPTAVVEKKKSEEQKAGGGWRSIKPRRRQPGRLQDERRRKLRMVNGGGLGTLVVVVVVVVTLVLVFLNLVVMVKWQHPDDGSQWLVPKVVVVSGMTVVELLVVGLPVDVANASGSLDCSYDFGDSSKCPELDMTAYWETLFPTALAWTLVLVPWCMVAYDASDAMAKDLDQAPATRWRDALQVVVAVLCGFGLIFGCVLIVRRVTKDVRCAYATMNDVRLPYKRYAGTALTNSTSTDFLTNRSNDTWSGVLDAMGALSDVEIGRGGFSSSRENVASQVDAFVYLVALGSFLGFFPFMLWGGIGLAALPIDLIVAYVSRPRPMSSSEVKEFKLQLQNRADELVTLGRQLQTARRVRQPHSVGPRSWKQDASDRVKLNAFKQAVHLLEADVDILKVCSTSDYDPAVYVRYLVAGLLAGLHSVLWITHILVYVLIDPPASPFLNTYLVQFETWYPVFGGLAAFSFAAYLQLAVVHGALKFGMRCFLLDLHPVKYNATPAKSFVFNLALFLVASFPLAHLLVTAFNDYARFSDLATLFIQVRYLRFFSIFFDNRIFEVLILVFAAATFVFLAFFSPRDQPASTAKLKAAIHRYHDLNSPAQSRYTAHNVL